MIRIGSAIAVLKPHTVSESGEYLGAKLKGTDFIAYETELPNLGEKNVLAGATSTVNEATLALATSSKVAATIVADDTVEWGERSYSVSSVVSRRKKGGSLFGKEYVIYLKG